MEEGGWTWGGGQIYRWMKVKRKARFTPQHGEKKSERGGGDGGRRVKVKRDLFRPLFIFRPD